jgi:hypothetical protein
MLAVGARQAGSANAQIHLCALRGKLS